MSAAKLTPEGVRHQVTPRVSKAAPYSAADSGIRTTSRAARRRAIARDHPCCRPCDWSRRVIPGGRVPAGPRLAAAHLVTRRSRAAHRRIRRWQGVVFTTVLGSMYQQSGTECRHLFSSPLTCFVRPPGITRSSARRGADRSALVTPVRLSGPRWSFITGHAHHRSTRRRSEMGWKSESARPDRKADHFDLLRIPHRFIR